MRTLRIVFSKYVPIRLIVCSHLQRRSEFSLARNIQGSNTARVMTKPVAFYRSGKMPNRHLEEIGIAECNRLNF